MHLPRPQRSVLQIASTSTNIAVLAALLALTTLSHPAQAAQTATQSAVNTVSYSYDSAGRMTSKVQDSGTTTGAGFVGRIFGVSKTDF